MNTRRRSPVAKIQSEFRFRVSGGPPPLMRQNAGPKIGMPNGPVKVGPGPHLLLGHEVVGTADLVRPDDLAVLTLVPDVTADKVGEPVVALQRCGDGHPVDTGGSCLNRGRAHKAGRAPYDVDASTLPWSEPCDLTSLMERARHAAAGRAPGVLVAL